MLATIFQAINCESAGVEDEWIGRASWPTSRGRWTRSCCDQPPLSGPGGTLRRPPLCSGTDQRANARRAPQTHRRKKMARRLRPTTHTVTEQPAMQQQQQIQPDDDKKE